MQFKWCLAVVAALCSAAGAQDVDKIALIEKIDARAGDYGALIEILTGPDETRALAAFAVMTEAENQTLIEIALAQGLASTSPELRARALWEVLSRRDLLTIEIETEGLDDAVLAQIDGWYGRLQTWPLLERFPETQCLNLYTSKGCYAGYSVTVSGLKVDLVYNYSQGLSGAFELGGDGVLRGTVVDGKNSFPPLKAKIVIR